MKNDIKKNYTIWFEWPDLKINTNVLGRDAPNSWLFVSQPEEA